ncbi:molybdopterin biosynthesis protein MoeA/LysR substrate binding-domain-containing protein [Methanocaldococcus villosus KIN24-T80]|uniref:molybdopterin molybdotransferase n=1 Tax=Methanocaldococcus villosus KIN24-T80 TaxID=1069083 RepID=N6VUB7_9EURY|nr:molybdopterin biosynthesis protein [Methanocaldococcus villosus]ENN96791.1 molybdopterin biosynthesis protein MoeA/LysR substrate binding-domain-containing protein [Methanocaldococcus villosus KIN24-T80]
MRYLTLKNIEEAKKIVRDYLMGDVETVSIEEAVNRVLAEDVFSDIDIPPFDRATVDGYAVIAEDTFNADEDKPVELKVIDEIRAGEIKNIEIKRGECVEIATGAMIPKNANAVVMVEYTEREGDKVKIYKPIAPMENIQFAGSDVMVGELVLRKNTLLTPKDIGVLAAIGRKKVRVYKKLKFAIISTGNELVSPGEVLEDGKIYDINSYTLMSYIKNLGYDYVFLGIVRDNVEDIKEKINKGLGLADIILLSGGTSAGRGDLVEKAIEMLGGEILIHGLKIKPGKPTIIGKVKNKLVIGLPGYPTSCLTVFDVLFGNEKNLIKAKFRGRYISAKGRVEYLPVMLVKGKEYSCYPITKGSGAITTLSEADGYVVIDENREILEEEDVDVHLFGYTSALNIIGSHCIGIDIILKDANLQAKVINTGSLGGILAIKRGEADIAGIHLLDEKEGYNIPYLKKYNVKNAVLIRGYIREQGFILREDLSLDEIIKNIHNFEIISRNKGAGTRILFENFLKKHNINYNELKIVGEAKTHSSVAKAVAMGRADIGIGIKTVADYYKLKFIKIGEENFDFLIRKERFGDDDVQKFIRSLKRAKLPFKKPENCGEIIWEG